MSGPSPPRDPLRLDGILPLLPGSEALRPMVEHLLATARPDPARRWSASGELGTAGSRLVRLEGLDGAARELAAGEGGRLERAYRRVAALAGALSRGEGEEAVALLLEESGALEGEGRPEAARHWAAAAARVARESGSPRLAESLRREARAARALGELKAARALYEAAFREAEALRLPEDRTVAATGRGNVAVDQGRWEEAERWYGLALEALEEEEAPGLPPEHLRSLRWRIFQNLGITHRERGELEASDRWYRRAEEEAASLEEPEASVELANGRGQLELERGDLRKAELHFRRALEALDRVGGGEGVVAIPVNLGEALLRQGRVVEAGEVARRAEAEALRGRFFRRLPEVYRLLASVLRARGDPDAFVFLNRALELIREQDLPPFEEALTLEAYARIRHDEGEEEAARDAWERADEIFRTLGIERRGRREEDPATEGGGDAR